MNILISSAGRRVGLMNCFRNTLKRLGITGSIFAVDCSTTAPAIHLADRFWRVPRCTHTDFIPTVLDLCRREKINLLVPTIDTELMAYSMHRSVFADIGTYVVVSEPETVEICGDKTRTHAWLMQNEYPTVRQANLTDMRSSIKDWPLPLLVKPRFGSASLGVKILGSSNELLCVLNGDTSDLIVQEIADGREYTVNVFVNREGKCLATVPHRRLAVRAGEVSKALTVKNKNLMELARKISETLPGAYGPMNIQVFLDDIGQAKVIEINPRFGGGFPVAYEAGADFPAWLIMECLGEERKVYYDDWRDKLLMLRYDEAVFISDSRIWEEEP